MMFYPRSHMFGFGFGGIICAVFLVAVLVVAVLALVSLRKRKMKDVAKALWAAVILALPLAGPIAYWIVQPGEAPVVYAPQTPPPPAQPPVA
jgi:hypothetical protein